MASTFEKRLGAYLKNKVKADSDWKQKITTLKRTDAVSIDQKKINNFIKSMGDLLKSAIEKRVDRIKSTTDNGSFLKHVIIGDVEERDGFFVLPVSFDPSKVYRKSLYPKKYPNAAYMPAIVNNPWFAKRSVFGFDRHDNFRMSSKFWGNVWEGNKKRSYDEDKGFIFEIQKEFSKTLESSAKIFGYEVKLEINSELYGNE